MALVLLVVVGQSWTLLPSGEVRDHLYDFLYLWHVPAFVLVTGFLSRSSDWTPGRLWLLVRTVAVPYVLFEAAMAVFRVRVGTPVLRAMAAPAAVAAAIGISLAGGFWAGTTMDLFRICGLLPFFVLGLVATPEWLVLLRRPDVRRTAPLVLAGLGVATYAVGPLGGTDWLYYSYGYRSLGAAGVDALATRGLLLVLGTLGALAFLALVPRVHGWFTQMGSATLVVYLLLAAPPVARRLVHVVDPLGYAERHVRLGIDLSEAVGSRASR